MTDKRSGTVDPPDRSPALGNQACAACYPWRSQGLQRHVQDATAPLRVYGGHPGTRQGYGNAAEDPVGPLTPRQPQSLALAPAVRTFPAPVFGARVASPGRRAGWPAGATPPLKTGRGATSRNPPKRRARRRKLDSGLRKSDNPRNPATWQTVTVRGVAIRGIPRSPNHFPADSTS